MWMPRGFFAIVTAATFAWGTPGWAGTSGNTGNGSEIAGCTPLDAGPVVTGVDQLARVAQDSRWVPALLAQDREPGAVRIAPDRGPEPFLLMPDRHDTLGVSLDQCVERALRSGEEVRSAEAVRSTAHARYLQARSTALPQVTLSTTYTRQLESIFQGTGDSGFKFEPDTLASPEARIRYLEDQLPASAFNAISQLFSNSSFASENTWNAALGLRQKLLQGGSVIASIRAAGHALEASQEALADKRSEIALQVRAAYLDALLAERGARIAALALEQADTQLQRVRLRQEAGQASEFELLGAEVQRENQVPSVRAALSQRELAERELRRLANLPEGVPLRLTTPLLDEDSLPAVPAFVDTTGIVGDALRTSGVRALEEILAARGHAVTVARAGYFPEFSLFANVSQQAFPKDTFPGRHDWRRDKNVGLAATWAIFDGFLTRGLVEESIANKTAARQDLNQAREMVRLAVVQASWELDRAAADLQARTHTVQLAKRALDLSGLRYEEGASGALEVSDARIAWQMAQINEAVARRDYFAALARLERYSGRPLFTGAVPPAGGGR
jgi:outer membrane protein TolC